VVELVSFVGGKCIPYNVTSIDEVSFEDKMRLPALREPRLQVI